MAGITIKDKADALSQYANANIELPFYELKTSEAQCRLSALSTIIYGYEQIELREERGK